MSTKDKCLDFVINKIDEFENCTMISNVLNDSLLLSGYLTALKDVGFIDDREFFELSASADQSAHKTMIRIMEENERG